MTNITFTDDPRTICEALDITDSVSDSEAIKFFTVPPRHSFESFEDSISFLELLQLCRDVQKTLESKSLGQLQRLVSKIVAVQPGYTARGVLGRKNHRSTWIRAAEQELSHLVQMRGFAKTPRGLGGLEQLSWEILWESKEPCSLIIRDYDALILLVQEAVISPTVETHTGAETDLVSEAIAVEDAAVAAEPVTTEADERKAYFASPDTEWIASYPAPREDSEWQNLPCPLDLAIMVMCAGTIAFDDDDDDYDYPRDTRTLVEIENECLKNGHCKSQEGGYSWIIKVAEDEILKPEPMVPIQPEILPAEPKPIFEIALLGNDLFTKHWVSQTPSYLVTKDGNLFHATGAKQTSPTIIIHYVQLPSKHLSNIQEGLLGTDIQLLSDNLSVASHNINGIPPLYLITQEGGVYQRMRRELINQNAVVKYHQVISEYLSNIEVVR